MSRRSNPNPQGQGRSKAQSPQNPQEPQGRAKRHNAKAPASDWQSSRAQLKPGASRRSAGQAAGAAGTPGSSAGNGAGAPKRYLVKEPSELLAFLLQQVSNRGRNAVKAMLARGQVRVGQRVVTAYNYELKPGQTVTVATDKAQAAEAAPMVGLSILHEDEHLIVVNKAAGLLSIATEEEKELTAYRQLMTHVRKSNPARRIFIVHRLDRDTSGVMLFAKSEQVQQQLQEGWQELVQERTYLALVEGQVKKPEGTIRSWLKESKTLKMYSSPHPNDGQHAVTHYKVRQANRQFSLLDVNLETGRKNQIRVHMEDIGHPIVGDKKYGAKSKAIGRLGLHARVLAFRHPVTGKVLRFETTMPKEFLAPFKDQV